MALKPRYKRRIFWTSMSAAAAVVLAAVFAPYFANLNHLKPRIENSIFQQTGIRAQIAGNVNFSLMGGATIVARDVSVGMGTIDSVLFRVPLVKMFNLQTAEFTGNIFINGANLRISSLIPPKFENKIEINDSVINFKNNNYHIIHGGLSGGLLVGTVRTAAHKYEFDSNGDEFHIKNKANNLDVSGNLYSDGSAHGTLSIDTKNINDLFEFKEPQITQHIKLSMDFDWNGKHGFKFSNIQGDSFIGEIDLTDDGKRRIQMSSHDLNFDMTFLLNGTELFYDTSLDLDLRGNLKFANRQFKHVRIDAAGTKSQIKIKTIIADDMTVSGGTITANGAENMPLRLMLDGTPAQCVFSGSPESWTCSEFKYDGLTGSLSVSGDIFHVFAQSDKKMPDGFDFTTMASRLGERGKIDFKFADVSGSIDIDGETITLSYAFIKNKSLNMLDNAPQFLPGFMRDAIGDFVFNQPAGGFTFTPHSKRWNLSVNNGAFELDGISAKDWFPNQNMQSLNDFEYVVSGNYKGGNISNLEIKIAGHLFKGSASDNGISLTTNLLNMDTFISQGFIDDYEQLQFLMPEPLLLPFSLGANVSMAADTLIHNGNAFANFVYSLRGNSQTFSITDNAFGNLLARILKEQNRYDITLQMNRFALFGKLLGFSAPFNISDTIITAEATLTTSGQIAYDTWHNLTGDIDMSFDGGTIYGLGIDGFYANAKNITPLNAEPVLAAALEDGSSQIKKMRMVGKYEGGIFTTSEPFSLSLRHADATGTLQIQDGKAAAAISMILRGTAPSPQAIMMNIQPSGARYYSLSQIMPNFDPDFLRDFVATHDRF